MGACSSNRFWFVVKLPVTTLQSVRAGFVVDSSDDPLGINGQDNTAVGGISCAFEKRTQNLKRGGIVLCTGDAHRQHLDHLFGVRDEQAVIAARQWRFTPARLNGKPVPATVRIVLEFKLH